ncbi:hypothetical protein GYMLUDRAFT_979542 [Collybiopsis luxurians FD-317 M1]|uniref:Probable 26S proteasome regulatory subunit p27 n=1 Tax=Collybiopsis luxurians FD-317 M1 TaxID=944289 RepID=A0A0D0C2K0_9AGAR|nr:hypothetical protein GYMLUDRAFT_979542 [Collybiopsis luxurians FD-317 M1]
MGFTLPSPDSPAEQARILMDQKKNIETEIEAHISVLKANQSTMQSPLVDADGFPRPDIDIYAVRGARVRIIELRNDLKDVTAAIGKALEAVYDRSQAQPAESSKGRESEKEGGSEEPRPFAKVDGVVPGSPAADAGLCREDLIIKFGQLIHSSFSSNSLTPIAELVGASENTSIGIKVLRNGETVFLSLTPRKGWGGRGMLGCHIVPFSS